MTYNDVYSVSKMGISLSDFFKQALSKLPEIEFPWPERIYSFPMNRTAVYVNYWLEQIALTCDRTGFWLEWDMCLDPVHTQVYLLHYEPEDWPI